MNVERTNTGTILTSTGDWAYAYATTTSLFFDCPFCIEYDVISLTDSPSIRFTNNSISRPHPMSKTGHYKIEWKTNEIKITVDGEAESHYLSDLVGDDVRVYFEHSNTTDVLKYRDFMIYPI